MRPILKPEVVVAAYGAYAAITLGVAYWTGRGRRGSRRLNKARPRRHVLDEGRAKALIGQVFGRHR